jgi:hypothetical protein
VPEIAVALVLRVTSASKNTCPQLKVPTPGNVHATPSLEVFLIVVEPVSRALPGSVRNAVDADADADAAPNANNDTTTSAAGKVGFRMNIVSSSWVHTNLPTR